MIKKTNKYDDQINEIINGIVKILQNECTDIILYGSASSCNLAFQIIDDKLSFFSDIEFIVVPNESKNENNKTFKKKLMDLAYDYVRKLPYIKKPPFIDVNSVSKSFFEEAQLRISIFELKEHGKVLKGSDLLKKLPTIDCNNYNSKVQNIELVKGLKILLLESYQWFIGYDGTTDRNQEEYCYFLSTSFLNVLRTLLPLFGIFMASAENRIKELEVLKSNKIIETNFTQEVLASFFQIYYDKQNFEFTYSPKKMFSITLEAYESIICLMLDCSKNEMIDKIIENQEDIYYGDEEKIEMYAKLTCFFISALRCINNLLNSKNISNNDLNRVSFYYNMLLAGENAYAFSNILEHYMKFEKQRRKIIGSKD